MTNEPSMFDKHGIPIDGGNHICAMYFGVRERDDVLGSIACDQLEIKTSTEHILSHDEFDPQEIIEFWDDRVSTALTNGYPFVRLTAEANWWMPQLPGIDDPFRYESELNRFTTKHPQAVLCMYDLSQYTESIVIDLLKTHPSVLLSGMRIENPYYLTPDEFLADRSRGPAASDSVAGRRHSAG